MKIIRAKLIIIGPHNVGKTSIVTRYQSKVFIPQPSCTVGASFSHIQVLTEEGIKVKIQAWDTAGQERFRSMAPMYYRGADGALLMFDLTNAESLEDLKAWSKDLLSIMDRDSLVIAVAGNKSDLEDERKVRRKVGAQFADEIQATYFETSARDNSGVTDVFQFIGDEFGRKFQAREEAQNQSSCKEEEEVNVSTEVTPPPKKGCCG